MNHTEPAPTWEPPPLPGGRSWNPVTWLKVFGPGAVIASLTIGAGELIFSTRGGALFGYRLLWLFLLVLVLKWVLVYATARHMVLTGAHPMERWMDLPGPRGWLPLVFLLLGMVCFPIWVAFHAGTLGTLLAWLTGTSQAAHSGAHFLWGMGTLWLVMLLVVLGGYTLLERVQLVVVALMLLGVMVSMFLLKPDWVELVSGLFLPGKLEYPDWIREYPDIASRPVWVETITYAGVLGGSGYDYLAYVSFLRAKRWGRAGGQIVGIPELVVIAEGQKDPARGWLRAVRVDSGLSFLAVLIFSVAFVACGTLILGPQHKVPTGTNLLSLQAEFVTPAYPWLKPVYFLGALLTIFGTLYGTIEVAPTVIQECATGLGLAKPGITMRRLRAFAVGWSCFGGLAVLLGSYTWHLTHGNTGAPALITLLTPANLFTGVLACGFIALLSLWSDRRSLPNSLRMSWILKILTALSGASFLLLGLKGYWDYDGWEAFIVLAAIVASGWLLAWILPRFKPST